MTPERRHGHLRNAIGNFLNQSLQRFMAICGREFQVHRGKLEGAAGAQTFRASQLFPHAILDHGGSVFVGRGNDDQGFTLSGVAQHRQDGVFVAQDAGLQDLQTVLAYILPVTGNGRVQGRDFDGDQAEGVAQAAPVVGDVVLREVARRILASVRSYDYVGRYGGEEFLIVLADCSASDLVLTAERMRFCVSKKPVETDSGPIPVSLSIGLVTGNAIGSAVLKGEELLRAADVALYCAKTNGRNRVEHATEKTMASQTQEHAQP